MKCIITGKETDRKYKNKPLSREGMEQVRQYQADVEQLKEDTGIPYIITVREAISHITNGFSLIDEVTTKLEDDPDYFTRKKDDPHKG